MHCLPRPSKRKSLTLKAEERRFGWVHRVFQSLRFKRKRVRCRRSEIVYPHRDPRYRHRAARNSPLVDPFVDHPSEGFVRTSVPYFTDSCVHIPIQSPPQEHLVSCRSDTAFEIQQRRGLQIQSSPPLRRPLEADYPTHTRKAQSLVLGRQSSFKEHLPESFAKHPPYVNSAVNCVLPRPATPPFPPSVSDGDASHLHLEPSPSYNRSSASQPSLSHHHKYTQTPVNHPPVIAELLEDLRKFESEPPYSHSSALSSTRRPAGILHPDPWTHSLACPTDFELGQLRRQRVFHALSANRSSEAAGHRAKPRSLGAEGSFVAGPSSRRAFSSETRHPPPVFHPPYPGLSREKSVSFGEVQPARSSEKPAAFQLPAIRYSPLRPHETKFSTVDRTPVASKIRSISPPRFDLYPPLQTHRKTQTSRPQLSTMAVPRASQFLDPSSAMATLTKQKAESIKLAREQAAAVHEMCRRAKSEVPPYDFEELIGKGAYGRVYKGRQLPSRDLVAIKVMDIDNLDYKMNRDMKDESIKDFIHEIKAMNQAKEAGARNINMLIEAISIHSQLWVVCEYCPGGSVKTLMRATGDKLEEKFIIPIARELASGLRAIHDAGIIHRDVKAGNVLIHEEGRLQICDFGVAGILQSKVDKRSTWIGTPHWMPPEMFSTRGGEAHQYGSELDVWAYGCTLYEFATGNPPNAGLRERMQIGRSLGRNTPKLEGDNYSQELKSLVSFSLNSDPLTRPNMNTILDHPYIADSENEYPTKSLSELVRNYYQWSQRGGQRMSLFHPGGAAAAEFPENDPLEEDWNFSTTDGFERRYSVLDLDQLSASLAELAGNEPSVPQNPELSFDDIAVTEMTPIEKANFDERVKRGAAAMEGLFDEQKPTYRYETKNDFIPIEEKQPQSDLPLRTTTDRSSVTSTFIDLNLGAFDSSHYAAGSASQFQLADADTIRANRSSLRSGRNSDGDQARGHYAEPDSINDTFQPSAPRPPTMDWKFPTMMVPEETEPEAPSPVAAEPFIPPAEEKRATRDWKFPVMTDNIRDEVVAESEPTFNYETPAHTMRPSHVQSQQSFLDLNLTLGHTDNNLSVDGIDVTAISRPSTATSTISDYDPFRFDRNPDISQRTHSRMTSKAASVISSSSLDGGPGPDHEDDVITDDGPGPDQEDVPELTPNAATTSMTAQMALSEISHNVSRPQSETFQFPNVQPPSAESLTEDASDEVVVAELDRLIDSFMQACYTTIDAVENIE